MTPSCISIYSSVLMFDMLGGHYRSIFGITDFNVIKSTGLLLLGHRYWLIASASFSGNENCGNRDEKEPLSCMCVLVFVVFHSTRFERC